MWKHMLEADGLTTIDEAQEWMVYSTNEGAICPCCGRENKVYPRKIHWAQAYQLMWLVVEYLKIAKWYHINDSPVIRGGDFAKLEHHGLITSKPNKNKKLKRSSGYWKPTPGGIDFVLGKTFAPKVVHLYHNEVISWSRESVTIFDALGEYFDYQEVMAPDYEFDVRLLELAKDK